MEMILGDVLTWSWFSEPHGYNFNSLLIPDLDGNFCIDPVEPNAQVMKELFRMGVAPQICFAIKPEAVATFIPQTPHMRKGRAPRSTMNFRTAKHTGRSR